MLRTFIFLFLLMGMESVVWAYRQPPSPQEIASLTEQIAAAPGSSRLLQMRGLDYAVLGQKDKAIADFKLAQKLTPNQVHLYWAFGWALFNLDDYAAAVNVWEHAAALADEKKTEAQLNVSDPDDLTDASWVPSTLAVGYWAAGNEAKALELFSMVAKVNYRYRDHSLFAQETNGWTEKEQTAALLLFDAWKMKNDQPASHL